MNYKVAPSIITGSKEAIGIQLITMVNSIPASGTWPAASRALFIPFSLQQPAVVTRLFSCNGAAVSGDVDMGIYTADGALITSIGKTQQAGTTALQFYDITDIELGAGRYYLAMSVSNTIATTLRSSLTVTTLQHTGMLQAIAHPLTASPTLVTPVSAYLPWIGMELNNGIL